MMVHNPKTQLDQLEGWCASPDPSMGQLACHDDLEDWQDFDNCQDIHYSQD